MRIYLIGYSYSGKTTMGRQLADLMGYDYYDTDKAIEVKYKLTIPLFFQRYGEPAFRIIESQILRGTEHLDDVVVATGGGTACNPENIQFILEHGTAIHMQMSVDDIMERLRHAHKSRPSLVGKSSDEQRHFIEKQLQERLPFYEQAPLSIPALHATAEQLRDLLISQR